MYEWAYINVCENVSVYINIKACVWVCLRTCEYVNMCGCVYECNGVGIHAGVYVYVSECVYMSVCVCERACVYCMNVWGWLYVSVYGKVCVTEWLWMSVFRCTTVGYYGAECVSLYAWVSVYEYVCESVHESFYICIEYGGVNAWVCVRMEVC